MLAPGAFFARRHHRHVHFSVNEGGDAPSAPGSPAGKGLYPVQAPTMAAASARLRRAAALLAPGAPLAQARCPCTVYNLAITNLLLRVLNKYGVDAPALWEACLLAK